MRSNFIISRNYRDPSSPYKWLVRKVEEATEDAKAYKTVKAIGVVFADSNKVELGFGCKLVAHANQVELGEVQPPPLREIDLHFNGGTFLDQNYFYSTSPNTPSKIQGVEELELTEDGGMKGKIRG